MKLPVSHITSTLLWECVPPRLLHQIPAVVDSSLRADTISFIDLGFDSLDKIELLFAVEERFGVSIPDDIAAKMTSVSDVVAFLSNVRS
jgi:acyl carrier protein